MITVTCDKCDRPFEAADNQVGKKVPCPACGDIKVVPGLAGGPGSAAGDRAAAMGLPPAMGPEVPVLRVRGAAYRTRPFVATLAVLALLAGLVGGVVFLFMPPGPPAAAACGVLALAAALVLGYWKLHSWAARLEVTNKRVVFTKGILSKTTVEMLHRTIQDIEIKQSITDRLLNVGTINIANASEDDDAIVLTDVPDPYAVRKTIDAYRPM